MPLCVLASSIAPYIQVELVLFKEFRSDNGNSLLRAFKNPNALICKRRVAESELCLMPATMSINAHKSDRAFCLGEYTLDETKKVYLQKSIVLPNDKNNDGFIPFFWLVEQTSKAEIIWVGVEKGRWGGSGEGG